MSKSRKKTERNYLKKLNRKLAKKKKTEALIEISKLNAEDSLFQVKKKVSQKKRKHSNKSQSEESAIKRLRKNLKYPLNGQEMITEEPPVFGELTDEQRRKVKRLLEERSKKRADRPSIELYEAGELADLRTPEEKRVPLTIDDFQHFIIYSLLHVMSTKSFSRWAQLMKSEKVKHRIFVVIEGVGLKEYLDHESDLETLKEFESRLEIITPLSYGGNLIEELTMVPLTRSQRNRLAEEYGSLKAAMEMGEIHQALKTIFRIIKSSRSDTNEGLTKVLPGDKFSRKLLLMSPWEMVEENYPLPLSGNLGSKYKNYVFTRAEYEEVTDNSPMWSMDCEMCLTAKGSELTRVCIVNEAHDVVYETLVKPRNRIINYVTEYSGITRKMLENVVTRLEDVQKHICAICPPDLIFIGQSLNGDLNALQMIHPYVIDTSVIFNLSGIKHRKTKLKVLTEEFLSERIQLPTTKGHCPFEDALAAMKLVQAKLQHSVGWGNAVLSGPRPAEESLAAKALLEHRDSIGDSKLKGMKEHTPLSAGLGGGNYKLSSSLMSHLVRHDKNVLLVGKKDIVDEWSRYCKQSTGIELTPVPTDKAGVKFVRTHSPVGGTTILHLSLEGREPSSAIEKADKLVEKLLRKPTPNTLYTILLAGRQGCPGNGVMFIHMLREHVPFVNILEKT